MLSVQLSQNSRVLALIERVSLLRRFDSSVEQQWHSRPYIPDIDTSTSSPAFPGDKQSLYIQRVHDHYRFSFESHRQLSKVNGRRQYTKRSARRARVDFITFSKYQGDTSRREGSCLRMLIHCRWINDLMGMSRRIFRRAATSRRVHRPEHIVPYTSLRILSSKLYVLSLCTLGFGPASRANTVASPDLQRAVGSPVSHAMQ